MASRLLGPLAARLALAFVTVAFTAIAVLGALTLVVSRNEVADLVARQQMQTSTQVAATLAQAYQDANGWATADLSGAYALAASARADLVVLGASGEVISSSPSSMVDLMGRMHGDATVPDADDLGDPRVVPIDVDGTAVGRVQLRFPATGLPAPERQVRDALARTALRVRESLRSPH